MRFRNLLAAVSVFAAVSFTSLSFSAQPEVYSPPTVFVRGLMMLQLEQKDGLHITLPDAPGHNANITFVMRDGQRRVVPFKGHNVINGSNSESSPVVKVPELIGLKELFGNGITPKLDHAPNSVSIPWSSVRTVSTDKVSNVRYTFVRKDNGEEIQSFRPRNVAELIRIELTSFGSLDFNLAKADIDVSKVKEIWIEQVPKDMTNMDVYREHFHHYLHYIDRPASQTFD
ncbi:MAG TPA: hypothetical protein VNV63_05735, partial [Nitrospiria bacterium]|nr:hypothetical protein [Nitrospiria bacterium]